MEGARVPCCDGLVTDVWVGMDWCGDRGRWAVRWNGVQYEKVQSRQTLFQPILRSCPSSVSPVSNSISLLSIVLFSSATCCVMSTTNPKIFSQYCSSKSNSSVSTVSLHFYLHCIRHSNLFASIILAVFPSLFFLLAVAGQVPARAGRARNLVVWLFCGLFMLKSCHGIGDRLLLFLFASYTTRCTLSGCTSHMKCEINNHRSHPLQLTHSTYHHRSTLFDLTTCIRTPLEPSWVGNICRDSDLPRVGVLTL